MIGSQLAEARRAHYWLTKARGYAAEGREDYAEEAYTLAEEHLSNAVMTDAELIKNAAICRDYEQNGRASA